MQETSLIPNLSYKVDRSHKFLPRGTTLGCREQSTTLNVRLGLPGVFSLPDTNTGVSRKKLTKAIEVYRNTQSWQHGTFNF